MSLSTLFREAALEVRRAHWLGRVVVLKFPALSIFWTIAVAAAVFGSGILYVLTNANAGEWLAFLWSD